MVTKVLNAAAAALSVLILASASAFAQTSSLEGVIKLKAADGTLTPIEGAIIDIYRVDINSHVEAKTDKSGHYVRLGLPLVGVYTVVASAPGTMFEARTNIKVSMTNTLDFTMQPGPGLRPTLDQVKATMAGGSGAPSAVSPTDRAKAEEAKKEYEAKKKEIEELQSTFETARTHYNQGVELIKANNFQGALPEFVSASAIDSSKNKDFAELAYRANANAAEVNYQIGVEDFNQKNRDEAKKHFDAAVSAVNKAITIASGQPSPTINNDLIVYYSILFKNVALLVEHFGAADLVDPTVASIEKAQALDVANKNKWAVLRGDLYRFAGRSEEATSAYKKALTDDPGNYDALYGLGLTLIASTEKPQIQEGANALADFVSKAPATDKRVPDVKAALEAVKNAYNVEAEKPQRRRGRP
jgi:tetratricopeptide (TPR) repeat protein